LHDKLIEQSADRWQLSEAAKIHEPYDGSHRAAQRTYLACYTKAKLNIRGKQYPLVASQTREIAQEQSSVGATFSALSSLEDCLLLSEPKVYRADLDDPPSN
jgi:hypothetical protein